jgi:hypothetical protein
MKSTPSHWLRRCCGSRRYDRASLAAAVRSTSLQLLNACAKTSFKLTDSSQFDSGRYDAAAKGSRMGTSV